MKFLQTFAISFFLVAAADASVNVASSEKNNGWFVGRRGPDVVIRVCKVGEVVGALCATAFPEALVDNEALIAALPLDTGEYAKTDAGLARLEEAVARLKKITDNPGSYPETEVAEARQRLTNLYGWREGLLNALRIRTLIADEALHAYDDFEGTNMSLRAAIRKTLSTVDLRVCAVTCKYRQLTSFGDPITGSPGTYKIVFDDHPFNVGAWELDVEGLRSRPAELLSRGTPFCKPDSPLKKLQGATKATCN